MRSVAGLSVEEVAWDREDRCGLWETCCGWEHEEGNKQSLLSTDCPFNKVHFEGKRRAGTERSQSSSASCVLLTEEEPWMHLQELRDIHERGETQHRNEEAENGAQKTWWCANATSCSFLISSAVIARLSHPLVSLCRPNPRWESGGWAPCSAPALVSSDRPSSTLPQGGYSQPLGGGGSRPREVKGQAGVWTRLFVFLGLRA